jgi:very-short-patch-repair endonuclease
MGGKSCGTTPGRNLRASSGLKRGREDTLLQEHGYFVLRFLAEDVGKHLDAVLDAILRALSHRRA